MKTFGSIIVLIAAIIYYVFGLFANLITATQLNEGVVVLLPFLTYLLSFVIGILGIVSFFKNVGKGIFMLGVIIFVFDTMAGAYLGSILALGFIAGGLLNSSGYKSVV